MYKHCCRTCLGNCKEMRRIDSSVIIAGEDIKFIDILQDFYNFKVTIEENYPENICINCVHQLTITYSFKVLIKSSETTLEESINHVDPWDSFDCGMEYDDRQTKSEPKVKLCKKTTKNSQDTKSNEDTVLFCVECKDKFNSVKSLSDHCVNNHPIKSSIGRDCEYCHEKFEEFRSLILHRKLHMKPYICENCWDGFYTTNELGSHSCLPGENKEKSSEKPLRQCDQCGKSYPPGYIRIHMLTHSDDRPYSCKYCPKKFKVPGGLHSHVLWNHKRTRNHKCEICNATFISSSSRSSHIRKHHLKEKKYRCESCGKRFFSKSELQRHSLTHTGVKNFHCHLCDKSYQTKYGLNVHLKSHSQMAMNVLNL